jgi:hypothetical protein
MGASHGKVVARYLDGRLVKGYTFDFGPAQPRFHVFPEPSATGPSTRVLVQELKALFFVRDFAGDPAHQDDQRIAPGEAGRHVEVRFRDGEVMVGTVDESSTDGPGFFFVPADPESNNLRVYVVASAIRTVYPLPSRARSAPGARSAPDGPARPAVVAGPLLPSRLLSWLAR